MSAPDEPFFPMRDSTLTADAARFYCAVGMAITAWAHVEEELFKICASVLKGTHQRVAIVYYKTPTLDGRLTLAAELVSTVMPPRNPPNSGHASKEEQVWDGLRGDIRKALPIRNQLAHSPSSPMAEIEEPSDGEEPRIIRAIWWASYTSHIEKLRGKKVEDNPLKLNDVEDHIALVFKLVSRLHLFRDYELAKLIK